VQLQRRVHGVYRPDSVRVNTYGNLLTQIAVYDFAPLNQTIYSFTGNLISECFYFLTTQILIAITDSLAQAIQSGFCLRCRASSACFVIHKYTSCRLEKYPKHQPAAQRTDQQASQHITQVMNAQGNPAQRHHAGVETE